jgi:glycosyltransferase involved in cell wall biosynthesis
VLPDADRTHGPIVVGVDAGNLLHDHRGIGRYARALLRRWIERDAERIRLVLLVPNLVPALVAGRLAREICVERIAIDRSSRASHLRLDAAWHPWNGIFFDSGTRDVASIHDVWPFVDAPAEDPRLAQSRQLPFLTAAQRAARILTDSGFSKSEIVRHLGVAENRIDVIPLGVDRKWVDSRPVLARIEGAQRYVLFVGEAEGRKDLATLLSAMALLPGSLRRATPLVIAGRVASSASIPAGVRIEFAGEVDDARLASLYAGAAAFAFPSRYEGFGLPVLEAMAFGAPVVASDAASVPEAGGDAACYFAAGDAAACATALQRVLEDDAFADTLRARGRARAALMTWDRCADATLRAFERVAGR